MSAERVYDAEAIHGYFELSYANYLVLHRTLMQSMPDEWQSRFVACLNELDDAFDHVEKPAAFWVRAKTRDGKFTRDPVPHYNRGRTRIEPSGSQAAGLVR